MSDVPSRTVMQASNAPPRRRALACLAGVATGVFAAVGARAHGEHGSALAPRAAGSVPPRADDSEDAVREWLRQNPQRAQALLEEAAGPPQRAGAEVLARHRAEIESDQGGFAIGGGRSPAVVVVDLFDYHCPACKRATFDLVALMRLHPDVRFVFKEMPILRDDSKVPAAAALAARPLGRYLDFHLALMSMPGLLTPERVMAEAQRLGIQPAIVRAAWGDGPIAEELRGNLQLARRLGVRSAPLLVVNGQPLEGRNRQELDRMIAAARKAGRGQTS